MCIWRRDTHTCACVYGVETHIHVQIYQKVHAHALPEGGFYTLLKLLELAPQRYEVLAANTIKMLYSLQGEVVNWQWNSV